VRLDSVAAAFGSTVAAQNVIRLASHEDRFSRCRVPAVGARKASVAEWVAPTGIENRDLKNECYMRDGRPSRAEFQKGSPPLPILPECSQNPGL